MEPTSSALSLAEAIRKKTLSPTEAMNHYLERIDELNPKLNAFTWVRNRDELAIEAKAAEKTVMRGGELPPFFGVPLPIKDLTEVAAWPYTLGSKGARNKTGQVDATVVQKLRAAGFILMGRTNSPEFGTLPVTENELYGATRNPWDLTRTPGGSSGGAAAAVASGMAPAAHASDGGGSIRIPASCTGLVGLKASRGRIPKGPLIGNPMLGFPTDGSLTRTVADTATMLDAMAGFDPNSWYGAPPHPRSYLEEACTKPPRLKIAFTTKGPVDVPVAASAVVALDRTVKMLEDMGHHVFEAPPIWPQTGHNLGEDFLAVWCTGAAYVDVPCWEDVEPINKGLRECALAQSSFEYERTVIRLQAFSRAVVRQWGQSFDLLLTPSIAMEPPPIGWLYETGVTDVKALLWRCTEMVPYSGWCNVTGQPAISLPVHMSEAGLPVGVQLVGPPFGEHVLLQVASELESACGWHKRSPPGI